MPASIPFTPALAADWLESDTGEMIAEAKLDGVITRLEDRGQNKGFSLISLTAVSYEGIADYS